MWNWKASRRDCHEPPLWRCKRGRRGVEPGKGRERRKARKVSPRCTRTKGTRLGNKLILKFKAHSSRLILEHTPLFDFLNMPSIPPPLCFRSSHFPWVKFPFPARDTAEGLPSFLANLEFYFLSEPVKHSRLITIQTSGQQDLLGWNWGKFLNISEPQFCHL